MLEQPVIILQVGSRKNMAGSKTRGFLSIVVAAPLLFFFFSWIQIIYNFRSRDHKIKVHTRPCVPRSLCGLQRQYHIRPTKSFLLHTYLSMPNSPMCPVHEIFARKVQHAHHLWQLHRRSVHLDRSDLMLWRVVIRSQLHEAIPAESYSVAGLACTNLALQLSVTVCTPSGYLADFLDNK